MAVSTASNTLSAEASRRAMEMYDHPIATQQGRWVQPGNIMPPPVPKNKRGMVDMTSNEVEELRHGSVLSARDAELLGWLVDMTGNADSAEELFRETKGSDMAKANAILSMVRQHQDQQVDHALKMQRYAVSYGASFGQMNFGPGSVVQTKVAPSQSFHAIVDEYQREAAAALARELDAQMLQAQKDSFKAKMRDPKQQVQAQREELDKGKRKWYNVFSK